jgi:hypothetical protein
MHRNHNYTVPGSTEMSDEIMSTTATFTTTLHLAGQQIEAFKAVGRERGTLVDWEGHYPTLVDLREMGLAFPVLGFWRLTLVGRQAYEQMFEQQPA